MKSASRTRVMHLVTRMNVGGVAVLIDNLLSGMDPAQFEVLLVTGHCEHPEGEYLDGRNVLYSVKRLTTFHKSLGIRDDISSFLEIRKTIKEFKPDIIHTHTSKAGLFGRIAGVLFAPRAKRVHTFHGHLLVGYFTPLKLAIVKFVERFLGFLTTKLIAMGTQVRDDLVKVGIAPETKFKVFLPGLVTPTFPSRIEARKSVGLFENGVYCIFIGRLTQIKRPDRVLDIARNLKKSGSDVQILVVGDGDLSVQLNTTASAEKLPLTFLGWRSDISNLLAASDMLLLTSDNEAVALTLIEASQAGIPVVTTAAGSVRDIAINNVNGFVTGFDVNELTAAVLRLANSAELREQMGANGAKRANELFSVENMVNVHQELYKELLRI